MNNTSLNPKRKGGFRPSPNPYQHFHEEGLMYLWTVAINFAIFMAMYKYRRYSMFLHFLVSLGVSATTIVYSLPLIIQKTIPINSSPIKTHMIIGIAILSLIFFEVILGSLCKILNLFKIPSVVLHYMNKGHVIIGYSLAILCKFQYYYIAQKKDYVYWILVGQEILFALLIIARKIWFPTLEQKIQPKYADTQTIKSICSLEDLKQKQDFTKDKVEAAEKDYCSFGNYVYDLSPLKLVHPAGYQILNVVRNREVDRFIYGMYRAELLPRLPANSHTFKSFDLLGKPIAKIEIHLPYENMPSTPFPVSINSIQPISIKCQIYHVQLRGEQSLQYKGYSDLLQLGRFYSLTINNKVTRLYTAVNFLHRTNIQLLRSLSFIETSPIISMPAMPVGTQIQMNTERFSNYENKVMDTVPLLIKVYQDGTLPNLIISNKAENLILSPPKGFGLKLNEIAAGTVLIVAGGTGLYPFSDLIDLLYKDTLVKNNHPMKAAILKQNPILANSPFAVHKFKLLFACQSIEDIHPITWKQLKQLTYGSSLQMKLKLRQKISQSQLSGVTMISGQFEEVLKDYINSVNDLSKVWLCGPPKMCESVSSFFAAKYKDKDLVHLI